MKYKYRSYSYVLIVVFSLLSVYNLSAQSKIRITGVITSESDSGPLPGATIAEKDKNNRIINGVITDFNGRYSIEMNDPNNTLTFSFVGFDTKEVIPRDKREISLSLNDNIDQLETVEIIAKRKFNTGEFNMEKRRIATAMATISTKEISETVSTGIVDQLQGRLSGVDISASSGEPGAGMSIRIRGTSSLNAGSSPLIVINNIPYETEIDGSFDFGSADEQQYASLIGVSADDIDEISVLKDAAATAQYGSKAANGVLLIKTKRGTKGKARFSYSYKYSVDKQPDGIPMLNGDQYSTLIKEEYIAVNNSASLDQVEFNPSYSQYELYNKNIDWVKEITRTGFIKDHFLSVSGGGEKSAYRISTGYKTQTGTTVGSALTLFTTRAILDYNISDKIRISSELNYTHSKTDLSYGKDNELGQVSVRELALIKMPNQSIYELDEDGNPTDNYFTPTDAFQGNGVSYYNPVAMANLSTTTKENDRISPTFRINYEPSKKLTFRSILSFDVNVDKYSQFVPEEALGVIWTNGAVNRATYQDSEFFVMRTDNRVVWSPEIGENHSFLASAAFETNEKTSQTYKVVASNTPSSLIQTASSGRIEGNGNYLESDFTRQRSLAANLSFNYYLLNRYIISGSIRREGNSKFGSNYRYGTFPALALKWIMSDEGFMESADFVDEIGIRASYGENGNSPSFNYGQYNTYGTYNDSYLGESPVIPLNMELTDLRWETVIQKNVGLTYSLFNNRVRGDLEVYSKETHDALTKDAKIPTSTGFSTLPFINLGDISNKGIEFSIRADVIRKKDWNLELNFNISKNENLITRIDEDQVSEKGDALDPGKNGYLKRVQEGNPIGSFYGFRSLGVYSDNSDLIARDEDGGIIYDLNGEPKIMVFDGNSRGQFEAGDARYEDVNKDGNIDELDVVYLGNSNALMFGGFGAKLRYKNLTFTPFFNFRYGNKLVNLARMATESMDGLDNQSTAVLRRWRYVGDVTDVPRAVLNSDVNTLASDRFVEDASFLQLKNITINYRLPTFLTERMHLNSASLFVTATNIAMFTNYTGVDPDTANTGDWETQGYDESKTPRSKRITIGLNMSF